MAKRRNWSTVYSEIINESSNSAVSEKKWMELFQLTKSFPYMTHNCWLAKNKGAKEWEGKFFEEMIKQAESFSHWADIFSYAGQGSEIRKDAIKRMHAMAGDVLYRWEKLKWLLPQGHPLRYRVGLKIKEIKKTRRKKRK